MLSDFEFGILNAFEIVFPLVERRGCFFHFSQSIWKRIQQIPNILNSYVTDPEFGLNVRQLAAIAFVPVDQVTATFDILMNSPFFEANDHLLRPLIDYFEDIWIGRPRRGGRRAPMFPHSLWNCYRTTVLQNSRTNNSVEGWNRRLNTLVGMSHPTIWKLIDKLKAEQSVTEMKINQLIAGTPSQPRRKKYRDLEDRLLSLTQNFNDTSTEDYLLGIAQNIAFYC